MFFKLHSDSSMSSIASWLPSAALYARNQTAVFRDLDLIVEADELSHSALGHLMQLIKLKVTPEHRPSSRKKIIKVHGVNNEIGRAIASIESFINDVMAVIAGLYNPGLASAEQDPELSRSLTRQTISNIFSAITQRGASKRRSPGMIRHLKSSPHNHLANA